MTVSDLHTFIAGGGHVGEDLQKYISLTFAPGDCLASDAEGRFVFIEYPALRGNDGEYLGIIEVTQDITELRGLKGDQRLLSYSTK